MKQIATASLLGVLVLLTTEAVGQEFGKFVGNPQTEWDPDGRRMFLLDDFVYVDPAAQKWIASKSSKIDGASIPQVFWSLIGGPFEGQYRNASVVHDTECQEPHKHDWRDVHRMFYLASRAGGIGAMKAKVMFAAVYHFGPRWEWKGQPSTPYSVTSENDALRLRALIKRRRDITLEAIEGQSHQALVTEVSDEELENERREVAELQQRRAQGFTGPSFYSLDGY